MKRKLILIILLALLFIPAVKADLVILEEDMPNGTYVIGNYMFTRETNEATGYNGVLTTRRIMLASKTITGTSEADMTIYYKKADGSWIDALSGATLEPETFNISVFNLDEFTGEKTLTDTKTLNGKTLKIDYKIHTLDNVYAEIYVNDKIVKKNLEYFSININSCGTGACSLEENYEAFNNFKVSDIKTGIIKGDKDYLYLVTPDADYDAPYLLVIDDSGEVIFNNYVGPVSSFDNCEDKDFFNRDIAYSIEKGTDIDKLYYVGRSLDGWHGVKLEVTFAGGRAVTGNKGEMCTLVSFMDDATTDWYEEDFITKTVEIDDDEANLYLGFYPNHDPESDRVTLDLIFEQYGSEIIYSTSYFAVGDELFTHRDAYNIAQKYDFGVIHADADYIYIKEYKDFSMTGAARYITILDDTGEKIGTIEVGVSGQGIVPTESHPNYARYATPDEEGYYVDDDAIYYLKASENDGYAKEYKVTISNGKVVQTLLGEVEAVVSGARN